MLVASFFYNPLFQLAPFRDIHACVLELIEPYVRNIELTL